jgi:hypothetical protein
MKKGYLRLTTILLFASTLWGAHSSFAAPPQTLGCVTSGLSEGVIGTKTVDGHEVFVRRMAIIFNEAMADFGESGVDDQLEIFCVSRTLSDEFGHIALCLSNETCPWR